MYFKIASKNEVVGDERDVKQTNTRRVLTTEYYVIDDER